MKALFLPLAGEHYDRFESGEKRFEFRRYKAPWTEKNCILNREIILSRGYGKKRRLRGVIVGFQFLTQNAMPEHHRKTFQAIYPDWDGPVASIAIKVLGRYEDPHRQRGDHTFDE